MSAESLTIERALAHAEALFPGGNEDNDYATPLLIAWRLDYHCYAPGYRAELRVVGKGSTPDEQIIDYVGEGETPALAIMDACGTAEDRLMPAPLFDPVRVPPRAGG